MDGKRQNILLTGIPRSGTTLACRLLSQADNVVALNEPMWPDQFTDRKGAITSIEMTLNAIRKSLLEEGVGIARTTNGAIADNAYNETKDGRKRIVERGPVRFDKKLNPEFTLILKHCAEFTLLLPELTESFPCFAIIRNPLALLGSWASVNVPVSRGKVAKSARLLPDFHQSLEKIDGLLEKQLFILDWYFRQYMSLDSHCVLKYEEIIATKGHSLNIIVEKEVSDPTLSGRNSSPLYNAVFMEKAANALLASSGAYWDYYEKDEIIRLLQEMTS